MNVVARVSESADRRRSTGVRLGLGGLVLLLEYLVISTTFDAQTVSSRGGLWSLLGHVGRVGPLLVVAVTAVLLGLGSRSSGLATPPPTGERHPIESRLPWLLVHGATFGLFVWITSVTFGENSPTGPALLWLTTWGTIGLFSCGSLLLGLFGNWPLVKRLLARLLAAGGALGLLAWVAGVLSTELWDHLSRATFLSVSSLLQLTSLELLVDSQRNILELDGFAVTVAPVCSGVEGMGLFLVLMSAYLYKMRSELRLERALFLLPLGLGAVWLGNSVRIAALMLIGARIDPALAVGSFHSKAGWVFFCAITLGIAGVARSSSYFLRSDSALASRVPVDAQGILPSDPPRSPAAPYLVPLLVWMSVGLVTSSFSAGHDPLYGLRVLAAAGALVVYRKSYAHVIEPPTALSLGIGLLIGIVWLLYPLAVGAALVHTPPPGHNTSRWFELAWLVGRSLGAVLLIPLCEELAFRGFLARRLSDKVFYDLSLARITVPAIFGSSLAFGLIHEQILLATATGLVFAALAKKTGRLSSAIWAHAASNLTIASWVLWTHRYGYW